MPLEVQTRRRSIVLKGEMNIYTVREFFQRVLPLLRAAKSPALDLTEVVEFDCSALQGLLLARREAEAGGKEFRIVNASAPVREALDLVQCDELRSCIRSAS